MLSFVQKDGNHVKYKTIEDGVELMSELSFKLTEVKSKSRVGTTETELKLGLVETVLVESGSFKMGYSDGDADEKPVHRVTLTNNYYMGIYEVTQKQWLKVMGNNPSHFRGENRPVEKVSWYGENAGNDTHEVGTKQSNSLGLYDMSGNVWE